jgi:hypothetical protein
MGMPSGFRTRRVGSAVVALCAFAALLSGCTTVPTARVGEFHDAAAKVQGQLDTTFASVNDMVLDDQIDRATTLRNLDKEAIVIVLQPEAVANWDKAMTAVQNYASSLSALLAPDQANNFGTAVQDLATQFATLDAKALPSAGLASAGAEVGRLLIEARAETSASAVARKVDPAMQRLFGAMAAAIGVSPVDDAPGPPLRVFVRRHWEEREADQRLAFLRAADKAAKRDVVLQYVELLRKADAEDQQLASIWRSLRELGVAHGAIARGSNPDLSAAVARIQQEVDATRAFAEFFSSLKQKSKATEAKGNG